MSYIVNSDQWDTGHKCNYEFTASTSKQNYKWKHCHKQTISTNNISLLSSTFDIEVSLSIMHILWLKIGRLNYDHKNYHKFNQNEIPIVSRIERLLFLRRKITCILLSSINCISGSNMRFLNKVFYEQYSMLYPRQAADNLIDFIL